MIILISAMAITGTTLGLVIYSLQNYYQPTNTTNPNNTQDTTPVVLVIDGPILPSKINITDYQMKNNYTVVNNQFFEGLNNYGTMLTGYFTGAELYDILVKTGVIAYNPTKLCFKATDGYVSDFLNITDIQKYPSEVIIAWAEEGQALKSQSQGGDGPLRSIVNITIAPNIAPDSVTSFWVKYCNEIYVE